MPRDRDLFRRLAATRIEDARALLLAGQWDGAYYLAGYAVECGLKSCIIARLMGRDEFPDKDFSRSCWTHDLKRLLELAGLKDDMDAAPPDVNANWDTVTGWVETVRYGLEGPSDAQKKAEDLFEAITEPMHGVLSWIQRRW